MPGFVMSLTVHARRRSAQPDDDGGPFESPAPPHNELAGFESWRATVYGSLTARRLGLRILPALADDDVYASSGQLDELEREVNVLRQSVQALVDELLAQGVHIVTGANPYGTCDSVSKTLRRRFASLGPCQTGTARS